MIPALCVLAFVILGTWILLDPLPSIVIVNLPEIIGRMTIVTYSWLVTTPFVVELFVRVAPMTAIVFYARLLSEMEVMASTPLASELEREDDQ